MNSKESLRHVWIKSFLAWAWLAKPKAKVVIPKNHPLPKYLRKKNELKCKVLPATTLQKQDPIIIKLKFTTDFDRCAILNVLNYLTKNFES